MLAGAADRLRLSVEGKQSRLRGLSDLGVHVTVAG